MICLCDSSMWSVTKEKDQNYAVLMPKLRNLLSLIARILNFYRRY
jgi:hypothetical protein